MQCLTNEQIQLLIDDEMDEQLQVVCEEHLSHCADCQYRYEEQSRNSLRISEIINRTVIMPEQIPMFDFPENKEQVKIQHRSISFWLKIAAVLLPVIVCWKFWPQKTEKQFHPTQEAVMKYELCNSVDANTAWQENMIITTVTDNDGKVIECSTN
jgi:hypothetical protein